jgi:flagellar protein FliL
MSEEILEQDEAAPVPQGKGRATLVIALTIGMIGGASLGSFVVGPLLADSPEAEHGVAAECACAEEAGEHDEAEGGHASGPAAVHTIENIVINPAQSNGTRFLMASVGFGLTDAHGAEVMELRDAEIRDVVVRVLGARTVAELADLPTRDSIKAEMREKVIAVVGEHALVDVYFSQFVIQ